MDLSARIQKKLADWDEKKHPRAGDGKFGDGPGDTAKPKGDKKPKEKAPAKPKKKSFPKSKGPLENPAGEHEASTDHNFESASTDEKQALSDYGGISYNTINNMLRGKPIPESLEAKNKARIEHIDRVMGSSRMIKNQMVYRGMSNMAELVNAGDTVIGQSIEVPNYWSTTKSAKVASAFSGGQDSVLFEINLKKGQRAVDMEPFKGTKPGSYSEEELLLPRGSRYGVTGRKVVKGQTVLTIEVQDE